MLNREIVSIYSFKVVFILFRELLLYVCTQITDGYHTVVVDKGESVSKINMSPAVEYVIASS